MEDVLASIDAAVDGLCACGCGNPLDPNGASMWFAGPECQWRYQQQHADKPYDVYRRPDATVGLDDDMTLDEVRELVRRRYVEAPPSAHAQGVFRETHVHTDEQMEAALVPTEFRIGGIDLSGHIRSAMLEGSASETERLRRPDGTLRRLSSGPLRDPLSAARPEDYWSYEPGTVQDWIAANPTVGERVDPGAVADFAVSLGLQLEPWQRRMIDAVFPEPQPRLFGNHSQPIQVGEHEIRVESSPMVPEGTVIVVNPGLLQDHIRRASVRGVIGLSSQYDYMRDLYQIRLGSHLVAEVTAEMLEDGFTGATLRRPERQHVGLPAWERDLLLYSNHYRHVAYFDEAEGLFTRIRHRGAGWAAPRNNPKLSRIHSLYRQRLLARRRRNRR